MLHHFKSGGKRMEQKNYQFAKFQEAMDAVSVIRDEYRAKDFHDALIHIFTTCISGEKAHQLRKRIKEELPLFKCVGISELTGEGVLPVEYIVMNIITSKKTDFIVLQYECVPGEEIEIGKKIEKILSSNDSIKGVEVYPANPMLDVTAFLRMASLGHSEVPFWGAMAVTDKRPDNVSSEIENNGFCLGKRIINSGFSLVIYAGDALDIKMDYVLGWKAVGKEFEYTIADRKPYGEGAIKTIDNMPAVDIYNKYLGVQWDRYFIFNVCEFPLMVHRNDMDICFMPIYSEDGELYFSGVVYPGEKLRLSYSTPEEILKSSKNGSERMREFAADAVIMSMCFNRIFYLGDEAHNEWDYYKRYNNEAVNCHGGYEIYWHNNKGGVLNSAIVAVGLREGEKKNILQSIDEKQEMAGEIIPISKRISKFFSVMTDELVHLQNNLEEEVDNKTREVESLSIHIIQSLAQTIDAKDKYTNGHSERVAKYAMQIAEKAGYTNTQQEEIYMMGLLHDVGKIGVTDTIINKTGRLTNEEFEEIKTHPVVGAEILRKIIEMPNLMVGARWHHERYDGKGYPDRLTGSDIPIEARIIAVADAYDAMTSNRSYRSFMPQEIVKKEIREGIGSQFDPLFASIMLQLIEEDTEYDMREKTDM